MEANGVAVNVNDDDIIRFCSRFVCDCWLWLLLLILSLSLLLSIPSTPNIVWSKKCLAVFKLLPIPRASTVYIGVDWSSRYHNINDTSSSLVGGVILHGNDIVSPINALYGWYSSYIRSDVCVCVFFQCKMKRK